MARKLVNDRQLEVLKWVVAGCPAREWPDETHKHSARALASRGLARVGRQDGRWVAAPTEAGRYYAEHSAYPPGEERPTSTVGATNNRRAPGSPTASQRRALTGTAADTASTGAKADSGTDTGVVKARRARTHPIVQQLRADPQRLGLRKALQPRALRWLNQLARETERRGHQVSATDNGIRITVRGFAEAVSLTEPMTRTRHQPTAPELARQAAGGYVYIPVWDETPSGRLRVTINGARYLEDPRPRKNGSVAWVVEDRVVAVVDRVEHGAAAAEERRRRERKAYEDRKRHWEEVRAQAVHEWERIYLLGELRKQAAAWREATDLGPYLEALARRLEEATDPEEAARGESWLTHARGALARLNPLTGVPNTPVVPGPSSDQLKPFMRGLSPWGP